MIGTRQKMYLAELGLFCDENITFNIVDLEKDRKQATIAVTNNGKISVVTYDLKGEETNPYFEYGIYLSKIYISDFEELEN